jgi:hypothetical protein
MATYVGPDMALKTTSICMVEADGSSIADIQGTKAKVRKAP